MSTPAERLAAIRQRIAAAGGGRRVTLVAASKTQPAAVVAPYVEAGIGALGENRVQEARGKRQELEAMLPAVVASQVEWHLLGPLQSNKVRLALDLFTCFHAIDRPAIATALDNEATRRGMTVSGFLEVNLGDEPTKHGFPVSGLATAARPLARLAALRVVGLMAIPPPSDTDAEARSWFRRLRELRDELAAEPEWAGWPGLLSMGMSDDFPLAIEEGATHVRIGTALFGPRALPVASA